MVSERQQTRPGGMDLSEFRQLGREGIDPSPNTIRKEVPVGRKCP